MRASRFSNSRWREQGSSQLALVRRGGEIGEMKEAQSGQMTTSTGYNWPAPCVLDLSPFHFPLSTFQRRRRPTLLVPRTYKIQGEAMFRDRDKFQHGSRFIVSSFHRFMDATTTCSVNSTRADRPLGENIPRPKAALQSPVSSLRSDSPP